MENKQIITNEYITQAVAEAARAAIQTMAVADTARAGNTGPRISWPIMKQPTFDWSAKDKYAKIRNFKLEVRKMLTNFKISQMEGVSIMKNWLDRKGLQLLETITQADQEACKKNQAAIQSNYTITTIPKSMQTAK